MAITYYVDWLPGSDFVSPGNTIEFTLEIGAPGADGPAGPNSITRATSTNFTPGTAFIAGAAGVCPLVFGSGLTVTSEAEISTGLITYTVTSDGASAGMAIGGAVTDGTPGRVLLVGTGPVLDDDPGLVFDTTAGKLKVLSPAGTPGTDELHIYHDGANGWLENKDSAGNAHLYLRLAGGEYAALKRSAGMEVAPTGTPRYLLQDSTKRMGSGVKLGWSSATNPNSAANDTEFARAAAKVVSLENGGTLRSIPLTPAQITSNQNNYAPGVARFYRLSTDASRNVTGLSVSQVDGQECEVWNVGSNAIVLKHQDALSTAANRFICTGAADITLAADEIALLRYDSTTSRWRVRKV